LLQMYLYTESDGSWFKLKLSGRFAIYYRRQCAVQTV